MRLDGDGGALETVRYPGVTMALLAAGDGTELVRHVLEPGSRWGLQPEDGWAALEAVVVLSGRLRWYRPEGTRVLQAGDVVAACPVREQVLFEALDRVTLVYVSSRPVFHRVSRRVRELMELAVAVELKDGYTRAHCERIMELSMRVGQHLRLPPERLVLLNYGAYLHDLGKVRVPDEILGKPGPLTAEEWRVMRQHTVYGRQLLQGTAIEAAGVILEQHHERYDGSGYPYGLRGDAIVLEAQIVAVADSYDAMTTDRVYRRALPREVALEEIKSQRGILYHPDVVDAFLAVVDDG